LAAFTVEAAYGYYSIDFYRIGAQTQAGLRRFYLAKVFYMLQSSSLPIIMFHESEGYPFYVGLCLAQARRTNPDNPVYFIGLAENGPISGVEYIPSAKYSEGADELKRVFFNISENKADFEYVCIKRWFVIRDFMRAKGLSRAFCIDSDVLLFGETNQALLPFEKVDHCHSKSISWGIGLINRLEVLDKYCEMVLKAYNRDPEVWPLIDEYIGFSVPYKKLENISDMLFLHFFLQLHPQFSSADLCEIRAGGVFDENIARDGGCFEMKDGYKNIQWIEGFPFCRNIQTGQLVRFWALHYWGVYSKGLIKSHYDIFTRALEAASAHITSRS